MQQIERAPQPNQPIKRLVALVTRRGIQERPLTGTTRQNPLSRELDMLEQNVKQGIFLEHESYTKFLTQSGRTMPDLSGKSYEDLTQPDKAFIDQTYKEYLVQKYTQEYNANRGKHSDSQSYVSYREYLLQSGMRYTPIYNGETLSEPDREYVTQTYMEYLVWLDKRNPSLENPPAWMTNPLYTQEDKERLNQWSARFDKKWRERRLEEHLKNGDTLSPTIKDGKIMTETEYFILLLQETRRLELEALARGDVYVPSLLRAERPVVYTEPLSPEQRKERDLSIFHEENFKLSKEVHDRQFRDIGLIIQNRVWKDKPFQKTPVSLTPVGDRKMVIKQDGTTINHSYAGWMLSYTHDDIEQQHVDTFHYHNQIPKTETLCYGIEYVTDRSHIISEAQESVTDEDVASGVKAYFIENTSTVEVGGKIVT